MRPILNELPETLDETYERILQEIPKSNRLHAHRLLQCLTVAVRPLLVEELAEVLAVDFGATGGIPMLNEDLRWEDQEQAVLSACSSLITVVEDEDGFSRVVQFSHFSVKEFLTSDRLATSTIEASHHHHILLEPSHTVMAQACLSVLLRLDSQINKYTLKQFPLASYASQHFGDHAEFGNVFAHIRDGADNLLDADKPHFAAWMWAGEDSSGPLRRPEASPLYHAAVFGFHSMVHYLISKHPEDLNVRGRYGIPLHAALYNGHSDVALLLLDHCVDVDVRDVDDRTPLHIAASCGLLEVTRVLVERGASINARDSSGRTPLHPFDAYGKLEAPFDDTYFDVVRYLLEHGIDVDAQDNTEHSTPLHVASLWGGFKVAQLLLDHGADINVRNKGGLTPLQGTLVDLTDDFGDHFFDTVRSLLEHGADVHALDNDHATPLHVVSRSGSIKAARLLLKHGADVHALDNIHSTPLHFASRYGKAQVARLLLEHGANIHARDKEDQTPQHLLLTMESRESSDLDIDTIRFFLERGADVDAVDDNHSTLLHKASYRGNVKVAQLLVERGANTNVRNKGGRTPLHRVLVRLGDHDMAHFEDMIQYGADPDVTAQDKHGSTPLHRESESYCRHVGLARFLVEHDADVTAQDKDGTTPLHLVSQPGNVDLARFLSELDADVMASDKDGSTPLHWASKYGHINLVQLLVEHGTDVMAQDKHGSTPLHWASASYRRNVDLARFLVEHGADVTAQDQYGQTPLHLASEYGQIDLARFLAERGADVIAQDKDEAGKPSRASER